MPRRLYTSTPTGSRRRKVRSADARRLIAVTSSVPQEGKTVSAINLALVLAEGGEHSVLLVDGDLRRAMVARMLGQPPAPGLAEVLRGTASLTETMRDTPWPNLKLIPAGDAAGGNFGELLGSPAARAALAVMRDTFDFTLIDTPPITTVSDVSLLAPHCDGALLVVRMQRTPEPIVQQAVRTLQAGQVKIIGCVLTRCASRRVRENEHYYTERAARRS